MRLKCLVLQKFVNQINLSDRKEVYKCIFIVVQLKILIFFARGYYANNKKKYDRKSA